MYTPQQVANFFLEKAHEEGKPLTQLKLLKLVYIAYGWVAAIFDKKLFDEDIQAWKHGPVVPSLYHEFKHYGSMPIEGFAVSVDLDNIDESEVPKIGNQAGDADIVYVLSLVWDIYKRFSASALRNKTHELGTPWSLTWEKDTYGAEIPFPVVRDHFINRISDYVDAAGQREPEQRAS